MRSRVLVRIGDLLEVCARGHRGRGARVDSRGAKAGAEGLDVAKYQCQGRGSEGSIKDGEKDFKTYTAVLCRLHVGVGSVAHARNKKMDEQIG